MYLVFARCHIAIQTGIAIWFVTSINGSVDWITCNPIINVVYSGTPALSITGSIYTFEFYNADGGDISIIRLNP